MRMYIPRENTNNVLKEKEREKNVHGDVCADTETARRATPINASSVFISAYVQRGSVSEG